MLFIFRMIKKIIKFSFYFLGFLLIFSLYELISFDNSYINKSSLNIDVNNARNPQIKRIVRKLDNKFGRIYFSLSKSKQKEFFESMREDEHFSPKPEQSDKSFFEKVKDMFS